MERIHDGPVARTKIKGSKVVLAIIPHAAYRGYVDLLASFPVGEVGRVSPPGWRLPRTEHLIYFRLWHEGSGGVYAKEFEYSFKAVMDVQVALPASVRIVLDLGGT